ncbi:pyridoxal-phosphate dependent enzyme [Oscillibacter valericigenes]|nr:pyridoxal-phosphate dependent enzyme [Oscillibacter valericigenes]
MKIEEMKKAMVGYVNTPLELMPALTKELGRGRLYIKRDDMTGIALGGNKARKLDYIVQYALDNGYTALMTFGGIQTNHGRLTAAAAIRYGLKPILVLKGKKPDYMSGNLLLDRMMGCRQRNCVKAGRFPLSRKHQVSETYRHAGLGGPFSATDFLSQSDR